MCTAFETSAPALKFVTVNKLNELQTAVVLAAWSTSGSVRLRALDGAKKRLLQALETSTQLDTAKVPASRGDQVIRPAHYSVFTIEPFEFCGENSADIFQFNITKYISRYELKENPRQDLEKTLRIVEMYIKFLKGDKTWAE